MTLLVDHADGVLTITLNRPESLNSLNVAIKIALRDAIEAAETGPGTSFLMAFANVGLAADAGASWTLPRLVGPAKATEMLLLAESVYADDAYRAGLLTRLVDDDAAVLPAAQELAARLAAGPTFAYAQIKRQLFAAAAGSLDDALDFEAETQRLCGATDDHRNATAAFVAKQRPTFTGA